VGGVSSGGDSLSASVRPALAAMAPYPRRRVALRAGGHDRGIDYAPLAAGLAARDTPALVLTVPDSGPRIRAAIEAAGPAKVDVVACDGLDEAVERGVGWGRPGGGGLLSPAAPSFGRVRDYADPGAAFGRAMHARLSSL